MKKDIKILAIETSCDETAAAVICGCHPEWSEGSICKDSSSATQNDNFGFPVILSNIVSSQIDLHAKTGGVVPEVASRAHVESIVPVISEALVKAKLTGTQEWRAQRGPLGANKTDSEKASGNNLTIEQFNNYAISFLQKEIDFVAVTAGPGLVGSLLVGFNAAKSLAYALDKPIIPVNHIEGHIYSAFSGENSKLETRNSKQILNSNKINSKHVSDFEISASDFPLISLTVSGGHTSLTLMRDHGNYENLGQTLDDAAGEAFDKVARLLDLGYPGGPIVSKYALQFREKSEIRNPCPKLLRNMRCRRAKLETNSKSLPEVASQHAMQAGETRNSKQKNNNLTTCLPVGKVQQFNNSTIVFPRPILNDGTFNFSFSGLKTAVLQCVLNIKKQNQLNSVIPAHSTSSGQAPAGIQSGFPIGVGNDGALSLEQKQEICAAFEDAVVDVLTTKAMRAVIKYSPRALILAGGVAANKQLRTILETKVDQYNCQLPSTDCKLNLFIPPINLCGDNAAMIGLAAYYHIQKNNISSWDKVKVDSNLEL